MRRDFATSVTGWFFILAAAMSWGGWVLMPHYVGDFFEPDDFGAIYQHLYLKWKQLPAWIGGSAAALGATAMGLTMGFPDHLSWYLPVFHLNALWFAAFGCVILRRGVGSELSV